MLHRGTFRYYSDKIFQIIPYISRTSVVCSRTYSLLLPNAPIQQWLICCIDVIHFAATFTPPQQSGCAKIHHNAKKGSLDAAFALAQRLHV